MTASPETILVVDDEKDIQDLLKYNLSKEGYRVRTASNGREALEIASKGVDLVVLDVMMPEMDGWEVCRSLRQNPSTASVPIVFLTARDSDVDEVVGLELGADDYIVKPVRVRTFVARVKKVLRKKPPAPPSDDRAVIVAGAMEIYPGNYVVKIRGKEIPLPKKEFEVLLFLVRHPDRVISREVLLNEIWGRDVYVVDRTIDVHIRKIREKIGPAGDLIETVKGVGYRFKKEH
jgi:two-component system, OmpR family, alkaline phosphatase synthesis response regulator PhoP